MVSQLRIFIPKKKQHFEFRIETNSRLIKKFHMAGHSIFAFRTKQSQKT